MLKVTYKLYSHQLKRSFTNTKECKSIPDFKRFAQALNLDYKIVSFSRLAENNRG